MTCECGLAPERTKSNITLSIFRDHSRINCSMIEFVFMPFIAGDFGPLGKIMDW